MIIGGVTQTSPYLPATAGTQAQDPPVDENVQVVPQEEDVIAPEPTADPAEGEAKGVVRLLMAGHFKGVADVRLRINFHDQIAAAQAEATRSAAGQAVTNVSDTVDAELGALESAGELSDEQLDALAEHQGTFTEAVTDATETFMGAENPAAAGEALTENLQQAFNALTASFDALIAPAAIEPEDQTPPAVTDPQAPAVPEVVEPEDQTPLVITDPQTPTVTAEPLAMLKEAFGAAMLDLTAALTETSVLPELSPPTGNGVAYEKFLAEYNSLLAPEATDDGSEADIPQSVDIEV